MQANSAEHQPHGKSNSLLGIASEFVQSESSFVNTSTDEAIAHVNEPMYFRGYFESCMEMYADAAEVASYLDVHREWFRRCALPMTAEELGEHGYALSIGRFGSFGYEVEPKIGLYLLPQDQGVYRIQTIPIPGYEPPGYDVDFQAALELKEIDPALIPGFFKSSKIQLPSAMTRVEWELHLTVAIKFPRFIHALPKSLIQTTGDRLLNQIVRQASRRLTNKVQDDFHSTRGIAFPHKFRRKNHRSRNQSVDSEPESCA